MSKYRVSFEGWIELEADSELEAESIAAFECSTDHCRAVLIEDEEEEED